MKWQFLKDSRWWGLVYFLAPTCALLWAFKIGYQAGKEYAMDEYVDSAHDLNFSGPVSSWGEWSNYFVEIQWLVSSALSWVVIFISWLIYCRGINSSLKRLVAVMIGLSIVSLSVQLIATSNEYWTGHFSVASTFGKVVALSYPGFYLSSFMFSVGFFLVVLRGKP